MKITLSRTQDAGCCQAGRGQKHDQDQQPRYSREKQRPITLDSVTFSISKGSTSILVLVELERPLYFNESSTSDKMIYQDLTLKNYGTDTRSFSSSYAGGHEHHSVGRKVNR